MGLEEDLKLTDWYNSYRSLLLVIYCWIAVLLNVMALFEPGDAKRPFMSDDFAIFLAELIENGLLGLS